MIILCISKYAMLFNIFIPSLKIPLRFGTTKKEYGYYRGPNDVSET